jgi:polyphosphate kinase
LFFNRELGQVEFNRRVLDQAKDPATPLLERLKFLCISCTNLDEFFEVRVASHKQRKFYGAGRPGPDGLSTSALLGKIRDRVMTLVEDQYQTFNEVLVPAFEDEGIRFLRRVDWDDKLTTWLERYFRQRILPVLSPLGLDPVHPFPRILNKSLNFAVILEGKDAFGRDGQMAIVRAPRSLPRVVRIPASQTGGPNDFVFLSSIIHAFVDQLFKGMQVKGCYQFRVTRNSELYVDEEEVEDLAQALKGELLERSFAKAVRLEITRECPENLITYLVHCFDLSAQDVYPCNGPVNLNRLIAVADLLDRPELKYTTCEPSVQPSLVGSDLLESIASRDILLHHPFESFRPVTELLRQVSIDPEVLAIKQTLYRTGADSPVVQLLIDSARAGKDVTAVIELRARFDEGENIELANQLQEAGVQVVYGVVGHKTHAKMLLIVRREGNRLKRYVHLGTGNYHHRTAAAYTDLGLMTANQRITADVHEMFQQLTGLGKLIKLTQLYQSPFTLHDMLLKKIRREARNSKNGKTGRIIARMNALSETRLIRALYSASCAGVSIDLIVRGPCCLRPGIKGVSENIRVRSVVGRFLEHSRVFYFHNGGKSEIYASSADWMERNLLSRVEACFPIIEPDLAKRVKKETLDNYLLDNCQAWEMLPDGSSRRVKTGEKRFSAQESMVKSLCNDPYAC